MFSGGDYAEVGRWLRNFVVSHGKREDPRVEALVDTAGAREGQSYGVRLRLGGRLLPAADEAAVELGYGEVASNRGNLVWCNELAARVRGLAKGLAADSEHTARIARGAGGPSRTALLRRRGPPA